MSLLLRADRREIASDLGVLAATCTTGDEEPAGELTVILDDYIHREADRPPVTEYGLTMPANTATTPSVRNWRVPSD